MALQEIYPAKFYHKRRTAFAQIDTAKNQILTRQLTSHLNSGHLSQQLQHWLRTLSSDSLGDRKYLLVLPMSSANRLQGFADNACQWHYGVRLQSSDNREHFLRQPQVKPVKCHCLFGPTFTSHQVSVYPMARHYFLKILESHLFF